MISHWNVEHKNTRPCSESTVERMTHKEYNTYISEIYILKWYKYLPIFPHFPATRLLFLSSSGDDRGRDSWMASPTQWTWVWASSRRWWRTGKTGVLQPRQRVRHDWAIEQQPCNSLPTYNSTHYEHNSWYYFMEQFSFSPCQLIFVLIFKIYLFLAVLGLHYFSWAL